jgi:hypothetical protein
MWKPEDLQPAYHLLFWEDLTKHWPAIAEDLPLGAVASGGELEARVRRLQNLEIIDSKWAYDLAFVAVVTEVAAGRPLHQLGDKDRWAVVNTYWDWSKTNLVMPELTDAG